MADIHLREQLRVDNLETGKSYYFHHNADLVTWRRVSKEDYDLAFIKCDGVQCLHTVANKRFRRHYRTLIL